MSVHRRKFLKYLGVGGMGLLASRFLFDNFLWSSNFETVAKNLPKGIGLETWVNSVCGQCPGGCGIKIRLVDGQPVKIVGNPLYPINRGGLCPAGHSGLQVLYHPDRIQSPMKRTGERGQGQWQKISWDEALLIVHTKLSALRDQHTPHKLVFLDGGTRGLMSTVIKRFLSAFGSPNHVLTDFSDRVANTYAMMHGGAGQIAYDLAETNYVLSFGADFLETEGSPVWNARMYGRLRQRDNRPKGNVVQVDTRFSATGAKADKCILINPGTEAAFALGLACVIIQEELFDREFIKNHSFGFDDWVDGKGLKHTGLKSLVMHDYYPEAVSKITGVAIDDLMHIARDFAQSQPGVAICGKGAYSYSNGFYNQIAIHSLNALVGNIGKPGGVLLAAEPELVPLPQVVQDDVALAGVAQRPLSVSDLYSGDYPIEALILFHSNPAYELPNTKKIEARLRAIPFIASFSSFLDESTMFADVILPDHTYLEKWQDDIANPGVGFPHVGIRKPLVSPVHDTRHSGDVLLELAQGLGGTMKQSFEYRDFPSLMKYSFKRVYESGRGSIISAEFAESMMVYLEKRGWRIPSKTNYDDFWSQMVEKGGWVGMTDYPTSLKSLFKTPSGKFEFYIQSMPNMIGGKEDKDFLPHYVERDFAGSEKEYPLYLKVFDVNTLYGGTGANQPMLMEMAGFRHHIRWDSWVELNPETAADYGIKDGDWVDVESSVGKVKSRVKIFVGAMPDVISMPMGLGHTSYGNYASGRGANPNNILVDKFDSVSKIPAQLATRVRIKKHMA